MPEIIIVLQSLSQCVDKTSLRQLNSIVAAMLAMTGRVTMLGISRWTEEGGELPKHPAIFQQRYPVGDNELVFDSASSV